MRAARRFVVGLERDGKLTEVDRVRVQLFGSLGATGHGHGSEKAVILGLQGEEPETVDTATAGDRAARVRTEATIDLLGTRRIGFGGDDLVMHRRRSLPAHPNGMSFAAWDADGVLIRERVFYSVGGGFVVDEDAVGADRVVVRESEVPFPFTTGAELLRHCAESGLSISDVMLANERTWRSDDEIRSGLLAIWRTMQECVRSGCTTTETILPGGLRVPRRAPRLFAELTAEHEAGADNPMEWVNLYALAVNEENASGGRIVTAPTNGAAGIVPAVLHYYERFVPGADEDGVVRFLLAAAAVGILFKENASISGAEVGCQGEVGSACSMAAGGLCEVLGGTPGQVENAAEIGIEHNLGLTCDPVGGLVQIPCIERNAIASNTAVNAAKIALRGDGVHTVSLDKAIKTMRETGADMKVKYKETSRGGLAVNVIEC
jgi:L-serine dehydratase